MRFLQIILVSFWLFGSCLGNSSGLYAQGSEPEKKGENKRFDGQQKIIIPAQTRDTLRRGAENNTKLSPEESAQQLLDAVDMGYESQDDLRKAYESFQLYKTTALVREDTNSIRHFENQVVAVSREMKIDCVWVKLEDYYQIWDATYINPYQRSAASFNQSKEIQLFDGEKGLLWASPLEKTFITSGFGPRWGHFHGGIDLQLNVGTPIYAAFDGIVRISTFNRGYGNYVVLRHYNGLETLYGHMSALKVRSGQEVKAGQLIGLGGSTGWSTGPHLHFETLYAGHTFNPLEIYNINQRFQLRSDKFVLLPQHFAHLGNKMRLTLYHQVVPGETLQTISHKYNVPVTVLAQINQLTTSTTLRVGQRLRIR